MLKTGFLAHQRVSSLGLGAPRVRSGSDCVLSTLIVQGMQGEQEGRDRWALGPREGGKRRKATVLLSPRVRPSWRKQSAPREVLALGRKAGRAQGLGKGAATGAGLWETVTLGPKGVAGRTLRGLSRQARERAGEGGPCRGLTLEGS